MHLELPFREWPFELEDILDNSKHLHPDPRSYALPFRPRLRTSLALAGEGSFLQQWSQRRAFCCALLAVELFSSYQIARKCRDLCFSSPPARDECWRVGQQFSHVPQTTGQALS